MTRGDSGVEIKGVSKRFGAVEVLADISLDIQAGEFVVFLGGSGSGKSTLLRMIAGLESLTGGEIRIGGQRVDGLAPGRRGVAMVFQSYALYPHMTVRENMAFGLVNIGTPKAEIDRRIADGARMLEMEPLLDRRPAQLSGGQRQRVAIGRAIVREPKVFLFDEPLSNLDAGLRARTRVELAQLHQRLGATMIFVTHDQVEAMTLASRIVLLHDHRIEQAATPAEIYMRPATRYVASFIGSPGMNFIPVTAVADRGGLAVAELPGGARIETGVPLSSLPGPDLTLGIRPEHLRVVEAAAAITGPATTIERLGERTLVHLALAGGTAVIGTDPGMSGIRPGDAVGFAPDPAHACFFDAGGRAHHPPLP